GIPVPASIAGEVSLSAPLERGRRADVGQHGHHPQRRGRLRAARAPADQALPGHGRSLFRQGRAMKLISYRAGGRLAVGAVRDERVVDLTSWVAALQPDAAARDCLAQAGVEPASHGMLRLLQAGPAALRALRRHVAEQAPAGPGLADVELLAPVPRPGKIVAVGRNYADHAKETGVDPFEQPRIVSKLPSCVCAPGRAVARPAGVAK